MNWNDTKRTRFKITVAVIGYLMIVGVIALFLTFPEVTVFCISGMSATGLMYKHVETKRKSLEN